MPLVLTMGPRDQEITITHGDEICRIRAVQITQTKIKLYIDAPLSFAVLRDGAKRREPKEES